MLRSVYTSPSGTQAAGTPAFITGQESPLKDRFGGWFVTGIEGDPSNVIGLSLPLTRALLQRVGVSVADLWAATGDADA